MGGSRRCRALIYARDASFCGTARAVGVSGRDQERFLQLLRDMTCLRWCNHAVGCRLESNLWRDLCHDADGVAL